ncbi:MAG: hypothetical protein ACXVYU_18535 [Oryzihumus sp.]
MYAAAHTSLALVAKRHHPTRSLLGFMAAAQAAELTWVALSYAGIEHPTIDAHGTLHLEHIPYSHSLLFGLGGALVLWAALRQLAHRPQVAAVMGSLFASHLVLDVIQHEPNIRVLPWLAHPALGLNLQAHPWWDFAVETALCLACWAYYRGDRKLLAALIGLNLANLPLMFAGEGGATPMAQNRFILPTVILVTIVMAWAVVGRFARTSRPSEQAMVPARPRSEAPAG